jgi:tRNA pseudouridine65 synthase
MDLEIIYRDERLVAINKPHGLLVHRSPIAADASEFAVQLLRKQLGQMVYPVHRLDRKTGGVLLFTFDPEMNRLVQRLFMDRKVEKTYWAIVRGHTPSSGTIDYTLADEKGTAQEAVTHYKTLEYFELSVPFGKHSTSRYSLVEVKPETGRMHQIREHFAHIFHPIIGDRPHGCNKQNKLFLERWGMNTMMLHALELRFENPVSGHMLRISAEPQSEFKRVFSMFMTENVAK